MHNEEYYINKKVKKVEMKAEKNDIEVITIKAKV